MQIELKAVNEDYNSYTNQDGSVLLVVGEGYASLKTSKGLYELEEFIDGVYMGTCNGHPVSAVAATTAGAVINY